jgi:hypothetical protein
MGLKLVKYLSAVKYADHLSGYRSQIIQEGSDVVRAVG